MILILGMVFLVRRVCGLLVADGYTRSKIDLHGVVECREARLDARGFTHKYGIDYEETFVLVAQMSIVITLLAVVITHRWTRLQMDMKNVFLHNTLSEVVYMVLPACSVLTEHVCHLRHVIYGLK